MKILVNGTSVNIGPDTWPNHLQEKLNCEIVNLSRGHAGNRYIHDSTINEISQRSYELVIINWNYFGRVDFKTQWDCIPKDEYTVSNPNYSLLDKKWYFGDPKFEDAELQQITNTAKEYYEKVSGSKNLMIEATLIHIISLQSILKAQHIPYIFTFYGSTTAYQHRFPELWAMIDQSCIVDMDLHDVAHKNGWVWEDHPTYPAHAMFTDLLIQHLNTKNLVKS